MAKSQKALPKHIAKSQSRQLTVFSKAILLKGEDGAAYSQLLKRVIEAVKPSDAIEEIWVNDIVQLVWESARLRRLKALLLEVSAHKGLCDLLESIGQQWTARQLSESWAARDREAIAKVDASLKAAEIPEEAIFAQTLMLKIDVVERIDRMITTSDSRRDAILREVDRRRAAFASKLRQGTHDMIDGEFEEAAE